MLRFPVVVVIVESKPHQDGYQRESESAGRVVRDGLEAAREARGVRHGDNP